MILRTKKSKSRRRPVEIYFVLYLSALLIILSEKHEGISTADGGLLTTLTGMSFSVRAEKNVLSYNYSLANASASNADTTNIIAVLGNVKNVVFTLLITDLNNGRTARLEPNDPNSMFTFRQDENEKIARFSLVRSRVQPLGGQFTVKVIAKAQLDVPENIGSDEQRARVRELFEREGTQVVDSTEFSIVIIPPGGNSSGSPALAADNSASAGNNGTDETSQNTSSAFTNNPEKSNTAVPIAPSSLAAQYPLLETVSYQEWENVITVYGTTNLRGALKAPPKVYTFPASEGVSVKSVNESSVIVGGIAPESGTMTVRLVAEFRNNSAPMQVEFSVSAKKLAKPVLPEILYPEQTYSLNPRLPLLKGQSVRAVILDGNDERLVSREGESITLQPNPEDVGKVFHLVRFVNDKKIGENFVLPVKDLPPPEILSIVKSSANEAIVTVRSYGTFKKAKNMVRLTFSGDCLAIRPRHGDYQYDKATLAHIQLFTVQLKDNAERASCELTATDLRGVVSKTKTIQ